MGQIGLLWLQGGATLGGKKRGRMHHLNGSYGFRTTNYNGFVASLAIYFVAEIGHGPRNSTNEAILSHSKPFEMALMGFEWVYNEFGYPFWEVYASTWIYNHVYP